MNWEEIKEKYPKALELLEQWGNFPAVLSRQKNRLLYEFFDENKILIGIDVYRDSHDGDIVWFDPEIFGVTNNIGTYHIRTKAEKAAFTKAFEILEKRL